MSSPQNKRTNLGSHALLTTLALTMGQAYATETPQCDETDKECSQQAIELIKVHGVRYSVYKGF